MVGEPIQGASELDWTIIPLRSPADGLRARLGLIDSTEHRLDLQYYLWDSGVVGSMVLDRLLVAADRGVRVRLLIDDLKVRNRTRMISALCQHPQLSIRVFNPWIARTNQITLGVESIRRFRTLDHRMHNKLLVADDMSAIVGGRNIADDHFGLGRKFNLIDHDLLVQGQTGLVFGDVFDAYWKSEAATDGATLGPSSSSVGLRQVRNEIRERLQGFDEGLPTVSASPNSWRDQLAEPAFPVSPDSVEVVFDDPNSLAAGPAGHVIQRLRGVVDEAQADVIGVTPFLAPSQTDVDWYRSSVETGVRWRILTNSLSSNMGTVSNSGLKRARPGLVQSGVELHELRVDAEVKGDWETPPSVGRYLGLHTKAYIIDRRWTFLGSLNLDPRSKFINTEVGVLIDDRALAQHTADGMLALFDPTNSWTVDVDPTGRLRWINSHRITRRQPARGIGQRLADGVLGILPIGDHI